MKRRGGMVLVFLAAVGFVAWISYNSTRPEDLQTYPTARDPTNERFARIDAALSCWCDPGGCAEKVEGAAPLAELPHPIYLVFHCASDGCRNQVENLGPPRWYHDYLSGLVGPVAHSVRVLEHSPSDRGGRQVELSDVQLVACVDEQKGHSRLCGPYSFSESDLSVGEIPLQPYVLNVRVLNAQTGEELAGETFTGSPTCPDTVRPTNEIVSYPSPTQVQEWIERFTVADPPEDVSAET